jgi:hypothetical protein
MLGQVIGTKKTGFEGTVQFGMVDSKKPGYAYAAQFICH